MSIIRIISIILILLITTVSCYRNSFENYRSDINEILNPNSSNLKQIQDIADVKDMRGCGYMQELTSWELDKKWGWGQDRVWHEESGINDYSGFSIDSRPENSTPYLTTHPLHHIIYIGPWHYAKRVGKEIRFVAYTGIGGGDIRYQYESKTPENENIKEKSYNLPAKKITASRSSICIVKWIANHGYNAIAEVEYKGFFNTIFRAVPTPTGRIIEVKE